MIADFWENNNLINYVLKMTIVAVGLCCLLGVMSERAEAAMTDLRIETVRAEVTGDVHIPDGVCRRMEKSPVRVIMRPLFSRYLTKYWLGILFPGWKYLPKRM